MFVRSSKYRHVFGCPARKELCYEGLKVTRNAHDSNYCAVNPKFLAVVVESGGGGVFVVLPLEKTGRVDVAVPKVCGHKGAITDLRWNPHDDNIIASCSEDATIKLWFIPDEGLTEILSENEMTLEGHSKKVTLIEWHPSASDILLSASMDLQCIIWDTSQGAPVNTIQVHQDTIFSLSWNKDGSLFSTTCKDRMVRVIEPRSGNVVAEVEGHQGNKTSKVVFLGDKSRLFTTGFSRSSEREYILWELDGKGGLKQLKSERIDTSSSVLSPYYDQDTGIMYLAGKGDGNIRYFEIDDSAPYVHFLSQYQSNAAQRGLGMMPKRGVEVSRCEITRFYKLHTLKDICEPIAMIVPRKSEMFQSDIFPPTASNVPALTADQWLSGLNRPPVLVSLKDGSIKNPPEGTSSQPKTNGTKPSRGAAAHQSLRTSNNHSPDVTTQLVNSPPSGRTGLKRSTTLPAQCPSPAGLAPARKGATRRRRGPGGRERGDSSSCSSTEEVETEGKSDWNENPVYNNNRYNNRRVGGGSGSLMGSKVDVGPLDDVLQNVQASSSSRQVSRSSHDLTRSTNGLSRKEEPRLDESRSIHDLYRKESNRLDNNNGPVPSEVSPSIKQRQQQFQSEPDITTNRTGSSAVPQAAPPAGRVQRTRVLSSGSDVDDADAGNMIDCISVDAPDDFLIKPSSLRESMRNRKRVVPPPNLPRSNTDKPAGLSRTGSLRISNPAAARQVSNIESPAFSRGIFRTASLRESRGTRPSLADWLRADGQKLSNEKEEEIERDEEEEIIEEVKPVIPVSAAPAAQPEDSGKGVNKKYQFTVQTNEPYRAGANRASVKQGGNIAPTNGVTTDGLHSDYKELLSKFFQQQDEIKQLKEQLSNKDLLIRRLEDRLQQATSS